MPLPALQDRLGGNFPPVTFPRTALGAGADSAAIATPVAPQALYLAGFHLTVLAATIVQLKIGATVVWEGDFTANWSQADIAFPEGLYLYTGVAGDALKLNSSVATTVGGTFWVAKN